MPFRYAHRTTTSSCGEWFHIQTTIMITRYYMIYILCWHNSSQKERLWLQRSDINKVQYQEMNTQATEFVETDHKWLSLNYKCHHQHFLPFSVYIVLLTLGTFLDLKSSTSLQKSMFSSPCCISKNCYVKKKRDISIVIFNIKLIATE